MVTFTPEINFRPNSKGLHLIQIRCTENRVHKRYSLSIYVEEKYWDAKRYKIRTTHPLHKEYNQKIQTELTKLLKVYHELSASREHEITLSELFTALDVPKARTVFEFAEQYILEKFKRNKKFGTLRRYQAVLQKLQDYAGKRLPLNALDYTFLRRYEQHLITHHKNSKDTVSSNLSVIRAVINEAIRTGDYRGLNPFNQIQLTYTDNTKQKLTLEELRKLMTVVLPEIYSVKIARDFFIACFLAEGCRAGDMIRMKKIHIVNGCLDYVQGKTGKRMIVPLSPELEVIINRYTNTSEFIFPFLKPGDDDDPEQLEITVNTQLCYINKYLKEVCKYAGIFKKITTHCARHTFTDLALQATDENIYKVK